MDKTYFEHYEKDELCEMLSQIAIAVNIDYNSDWELDDLLDIIQQVEEVVSD